MTAQVYAELGHRQRGYLRGEFGCAVHVEERVPVAERSILRKVGASLFITRPELHRRAIRGMR